MGVVVLSDGQQIDGGRMLMRAMWNAQLYEPLLRSYEHSQTTPKPDQWFHKVSFLCPSHSSLNRLCLLESHLGTMGSSISLAFLPSGESTDNSVLRRCEHGPMRSEHGRRRVQQRLRLHSDARCLWNVEPLVRSRVHRAEMRTRLGFYD